MIIRYRTCEEAERDLPRVYRKLCQKQGLDPFLSFPLPVPRRLMLIFRASFTKNI